MNLSMAVGIFAPDASYRVSELPVELARQWPALPKPRAIQFHDNFDLIEFRIGRYLVTGGWISADTFSGKLKQACAVSRHWTHGVDELDKHLFLLLAVTGPRPRVLDRTLLLARLVACSLAASSQSIGCYWIPTDTAYSKQKFADYLSVTLPDLWVEFRTWRNAGGLSSGLTCGMRALGHLEIEAESPELPVVLKEHLYDAAMHVLRHNGEVENGTIIGPYGAGWLCLRHARSQFGKGKILRLEYQGPSKEMHDIAGVAGVDSPFNKSTCNQKAIRQRIVNLAYPAVIRGRRTLWN